ncbi:transporter [Burkholderia contaminans]|nr:transporter [Burkholderia contaminans]MCA7917127.1 transporter [Burkholderia contaminans]MCA8099489.1 transporter [Burkholderia contaminans]UUX36085.1 transporter [Burkholderia contaminans]
MRIESTRTIGVSLATFACLTGMILPIAAHACATCGCSLSTDAATGYSATPGWRVSLDFTFLPQNQLRSGRSAVSGNVPAAINAAGGSQEVENQTINRYWNLGINYSPNAKWNFGAIVPFVDRGHSTYGNATPDQLTPDNLSGVTSKGLGDIKLIASYQGFLPTHNLGVQLGVKLPTGKYGGQNVLTGATVGRSPVFFSSGPNSANGQALDSSLQPGTGSTDLIVGAYYYQPISQNFDAFINGQFQSAVFENLRGIGEDYRPGNLATVSVGLRYEANPRIVPQLQINVTRKSADQGALADTANTAGTVVYLSPGVTVNVVKNLNVYAFVQKALFSRLSGYQLFPRWSGTVGASYAF